MALAEKLTHENAGASSFTGSHCVYVPKGKGMTKEDVKSGSTFASYMASASAAALAYVTMKYFNLAGSPDETGSLLFYGLLYAFIFLAFRFFTSRFCKWLYS